MGIFFGRMKIHYVTGNKGKFEEAYHILQVDDLQKKGWQIVHTPLHLEEVQGKSRDIAFHKVKEAYSQIHEPCLIDDVAIFCPAVGGLPGPYIRSFLEALGDVGLWKLISHYEDRSCVVSCSIAFLQDSFHDPLIFEGTINAKIVAPRGSRMGSALSWNAIIEPEGFTHTFAEMTIEEMSRSSARNKALLAFRNYLLTEIS